jgi:hypothetical protein
MMKAITKYGQRAAVVTKAHALWLSVHKIRTYKDRKVLPDQFTCFKVQTSTLTTTSHQILKSHVNQELQHKRSNHDAQLIEARKQSLRPGGLKSRAAELAVGRLKEVRLDPNGFNTCLRRPVLRAREVSMVLLPRQHPLTTAIPHDGQRTEQRRKVFYFLHDSL